MSSNPLLPEGPPMIKNGMKHSQQSKWPPKHRSVVMIVQIDALKLVRQLTENQSPRLARNTAKISHAPATNGSARTFNPVVISPSPQIRQSHNQPHRTDRTLPSNLANKIDVLSRGVVSRLSMVWRSRSPVRVVAARTATASNRMIATAVPATRTQMFMDIPSSWRKSQVVLPVERDHGRARQVPSN